MWDLIVLIPDHCLSIYMYFTLFHINDTRTKAAVGRAMVLGNLQYQCVLLMEIIIRQGWALFEYPFLSIIVSIFFLPLSGSRSEIDCLTI